MKESKVEMWVVTDAKSFFLFLNIFIINKYTPLANYVKLLVANVLTVFLFIFVIKRNGNGLGTLRLASTSQ